MKRSILLATIALIISVFCATYKNTQKNLFKDSASSFGLGMLYPFGICIGAVIIRKLALSYSCGILFFISTIL